MGEGTWGKTTYKLTKNGKRARIALPEGRVPTPVAYPALVTPEDWHAAQASTRSCAVRARTEDYLFYGGMVRCAEHGGAMTGSRTGKGRRYYRCVRHLHPGGHASHGIPAQALEGAVWAQIYGAMTDEALMVAAAQRMAREAEEGIEEIARRRTVIAARLEELDRQVQWVMTELREAGASSAEIAAQLRQIRDEQARLRAEVEPLAARMALCQADLPRAQQVQALCRDRTMQVSAWHWYSHRQRPGEHT
jgi:Recombinase zinc beta ribbon domain